MPGKPPRNRADYDHRFLILHLLVVPIDQTKHRSDCALEREGRQPEIPAPEERNHARVRSPQSVARFERFAAILGKLRLHCCSVPPSWSRVRLVIRPLTQRVFRRSITWAPLSLAERPSTSPYRRDLFNS